MSKKLYVGNLSYDVDQSMLTSMLAEFGDVASAQIATERDTGRSKGFGFVEMETEAGAKAAIRGLTGQMRGGRSLTINEAKPRPERGGAGLGRN